MFLGYWCKIRSEPRTPHACWLCPSINRCRCEALLSEPFGSQLMMGHSERERERASMGFRRGQSKHTFTVHLTHGLFAQNKMFHPGPVLLIRNNCLFLQEQNMKGVEKL